NPVRRSEIFAGTGSAKVALTEAIKSLSNVSGREAGILSLHQFCGRLHLHVKHRLKKYDGLILREH
ncbi:hypothetical protein, partial [Salmonella enterica]